MAARCSKTLGNSEHCASFFYGLPRLLELHANRMKWYIANIFHGVALRDRKPTCAGRTNSAILGTPILQVLDHVWGGVDIDDRGISMNVHRLTGLRCDGNFKNAHLAVFE